MLEIVRAMALDDQGDPVAVPAAETLSDAPEVKRVPRLFAADECLYLRQLAEPLYRASTVNDGRGGVVRDPIRTSDGATLHWLIEDPAVHALNRRLAAASGSLAECGEAIQILRYRIGEEYRPHLDAVRIVDNPRVLTALVWLNRDFEGGETRFTETGLTVRGEPGDALMFRNVRDGRPDPVSRHAGLPIRAGTKYLASRWIRAQRWVP
jgi:prolyl 4-hydroxylase